MVSLPLYRTRQWFKQSNHPLAKLLVKQIKAIRLLEIPIPKIVSSLLYIIFCNLRSIFATVMRIAWWTPLFRGRLNQAGKHLYLYGGLPFITGPLVININNDCRISGQTTLSGRTASMSPPLLMIGSNVDIGWMTTIAVGSQVKIGNNVRIAGRTLLAGYPGHPINAEARAQGLPETDDQVGDIILEDDVWLATGVSVMAGVRIGQGTIVATGSIVTKDLPPMVLAGGNPAKVIRPLTPATSMGDISNAP